MYLLRPSLKMINMKKIYLLLLFWVAAIAVKAQTYTMPTSGTLTANICGGDFYDNGGPSGNYACCSIAGIYTFYPIIPGTKVSVSFSSFSVETCCDYLRIYNGNSTGASLVGTYNSLPPSFTSTAADGSLTFYFYSDVSIVSSGFAATLSTTPATTSPITTHPAATTSTCIGSSTSISVASTGTNTYQWYNNGTTNSNTGGSLIGGATAATYAPSTAAVGTTYYYCRVTDECGTQFFSNAGGVTVNPGPNTTNFSVPSLASVCQGSSRVVTVNSSSLGVGSYTVTYNLSGANSSSGNTATLTMGASNGTFTIPSSQLTANGSTTVTITSIVQSGCSTTISSSNTATFSVNANPNVTNFTSPTATSQCAGLNGTATVNSTTLGSGSTFTVTYSLSGANSSSGNTASVTMGAANGTFTIPAILISNAGSTTMTINSIANASGCSANLFSSNAASFTVSAASVAFAMTGGGGYCSGGSGVAVGISASSTGNTYQLYNGASTVGSPIGGTGGAFSFGTFTATGSYSVLATNTTSLCARASSTSTPITISPVPVAYNVGGGGSYCSGVLGSAPSISLDASDAGASYQLYNGATAIGGYVTGTGLPISFGTQTMAGTYTIIANPGAGAGCQLAMSGSASVSINSLPTAYNVTGGGNYCAGTSGVPIGVSFGNTGVTYDLKQIGGSIVTSASGTGAALSFGNITTIGSYSVQATITATGCTNAMNGTVAVSTNPVPAAQTVTGGGGYCSGGTGVPVGLGNSVSGVTYQIYLGSTAGTSVPGTGSSITFGNQTSTGAYSVLATLGSCTTAMTGTATVIQNPTPTVYTVTGGGNYCSGGTGSTISLNGSQPGINYTLYNGGTSVSTVAGTGAAINFGLFTAAGTYSVLATNGTTSCTAAMSGSAVIAVNPLPNIYGVGGGGNYCNGGSGYSVTLGGSQTGVSYVLYRSGSPILTLAGTGGSLNFGTFPEAGNYTIIATNVVTGCMSTQSGSAVINVNPLPVVYPVTGGGNYCSGGTGVAVGLGGSASGITYTLYNGAVAMTPTVNGTGSPITFGLQTLSGSYTVFAVNSGTGCTNNMSGSATIGINPLPTAYAVTGTGNYCAGGTGVAVGLGSSAGGVTYNLYNGASLVGSASGTGGAINFGMYTTAATYTVQAVNTTTSCVNNMSGGAVVGINPLPTLYTVTSGGTNYCAGTGGIVLGMSGSTSGVDYQLYYGSAMSGTAVSGTGSGITFGSKTAAGTYTVSATNATTGCTRNMSGSASITIDPLPTAFVVSGGGNYCSGGTGVAITLSGSESGLSYQLYNGAAAVGAIVPGTGAAMSMGTYTAAGTYTVMATNPATTCFKSMSGAATISINALPIAQTVTSSGTNYCAGTSGINIGLAASAVGVNYQLYLGVTPVGGPVAGTGSALSLGTHTATGTYMVIGTNAATGCSKNMNGTATISVNPAPVIYGVTGGGHYCEGNAGVNIGLGGSNSGINYQLFNGSLAVGGPVAGTGGLLDFGVYTTSATYYVVASDNVTGCTSNMSGSATVVADALPTQYTVTGGGSYCNGGAGLGIALSGSTPGIAYQLYQGATAVGSYITGTGVGLSFGTMMAPGVYTIVGYNPATTCISTMTGSASITVNSLPIVHTVTGGGSYCNGGSGVNIGLSNSTPGVSYQVYNGTASFGTAILGSGDPIDFGSFTSAGTYTVRATSISTSCVNAMSGNAVVTISPLPTVQTVTGGGTVCQGTAGANVYLNNTNAGINYQLYNNGAPVGAPVPGTGSALSFGPQSAAGTYTVQAINATTTCVRNMSGAATINVNAWPALHTVTGGGNYCAGDAGSAIGLGSSTPGINYQLYFGTTATGGLVAGTGGPLSFGSYTASGTYSVMAINATTGCTRTMTGVATVGINNLPTVYTLTGGGNICAGSTGTAMMLSGSNTGITYQLFNGTTAVNAPVIGTGAPLNFGMVTGGGTYHVIATNDITSCPRYMNGTPAVNVNALPVAYTVMGGGDYCAGGAGIEITLSGSNTGISYQLYKGGAISGTPVAGTGGDISFGNQTAQGTYSVLATNTATTCTNAMNGSASVMINALPVANNVSGGGTICAGQPGAIVTMNTSTTGIGYQLMLGTTAVGPLMSGTGAAINFLPVTVSGTYMVVATDAATTCSNTMNGSGVVVVNAVPVAQTVTGGGNYCSGGSGVAVGLAGSVSGVSYQLMNGATAAGSPVTGTGTAITFGMQTAAGAYSVVATNSNGCSSDMTGIATVNINALPTAYTILSLGSSYCAGGEGVHVLLSGSSTGVAYQLYRAGAPTGAPVTGTGAIVDFGAQTVAGNYTVMANNTTTSCSAPMSGSVAVIVNALPTAYAVTGGGGYCTGAAGADINLAGSNAGISYQLMGTAGAVGSPVAGTGGPISFGPQTAGTYQVLATNTATTCSNMMTGSVTSVMNALPTAYAVTGGGAYCAGGTGVNIGLSNSNATSTYQLYKDGGPVGSPVAGIGGTLSFGPQTAAGDYTIMATNTTTTCTNGMIGIVTVTINSLPEPQTVTGGGEFCAGGAGVSVGLAGSAAGVNYQLYKGLVSVTGAIMAGTGSAIDFGAQAASGNYNVVATSVSNGCTSMMTGSADVTANPLPTVFTMTGGGNYCATPAATGLAIGLSGSTPGVNYQLYLGGMPTGTTVAGTGSAISFGMQTMAGTYTAMAVNATTMCNNNMGGSATITVNAAVVPAVTVATGVGNTVCLGVLTTFTATSVNGGIAPTYQWKVNGANTGLGTNAFSYVPIDGDVVSITMNSSEACASPAAATASITMIVSSHQTPVAKVSVSPNDTVCAGTMVTYNVTPEFGGAAPTFVWKKNGVTVGGGTSYSYVPSNNDVITCEMTSNFPCRLEDVVSTDVKMSVQNPGAPVVTISANPGLSIGKGETVTLTAAATTSGAMLTYQWLVNSTPITGATNASYTSNTFENNDNVTVEVTSHGACAAAMSAKTVKMTVGTVGVASVTNTEIDIRLIPNPNNGDFVIRGTIGATEDKELNVEVVNMIGQVVYKGTVAARNGTVNERIQISNTLANGMYILNLRSETETKAFHFVLQN
jgi:hypothetical protein